MRDELERLLEERGRLVSAVQRENDALRARLAEADAAVRAFTAWLEHDDGKPTYPPGTDRDSPGNEEIWREWYVKNLRLCAVALDLGRAYVRPADNGCAAHTGEGNE